MISTPEEFGLLLKKWKSASAKLGVLIMPSPSLAQVHELLVQMTGEIADINAGAETFSFVDESGGTLVMCYSRCHIGYAGSNHEVVTELQRLLGDAHVEDLVLVQTPMGMGVVLYTLPQEKS